MSFPKPVSFNWKNIFGLTIPSPIVEHCCTVFKKVIEQSPDSLKNVEIEGRIGKFLSVDVKPNTNSKYSIDGIGKGYVPILKNSTTRKVPYRFDPNIDKEVFDNLKNYLSQKVNVKSDVPIGYRKTHHIDKIYKDRVRATYDFETKKLLEVIRKENLSPDGIQILNNQRAFDFRIAVKKEQVLDLNTPLEYCEHVREKLRRSFLVLFFSIDLTEVKSWRSEKDYESKSEPKITYEIEIEIRSSSIAPMRQSFEQYMNGKGNTMAFMNLVDSLVDTIYTLIHIMSNRVASNRLPSSEVPFSSSQPPTSRPRTAVDLKDQDKIVQLKK